MVPSVLIVDDEKHTREGLQQALDAWTELSDFTTHFVLVDFAAGQYRIHARQHDGGTGMCPGVARQTQTADGMLRESREVVVRLGVPMKLVIPPSTVAANTDSSVSQPISGLTVV